jgi:hypothetical protein
MRARQPAREQAQYVQGEQALFGIVTHLGERLVQSHVRNFLCCRRFARLGQNAVVASMHDNIQL